jgi:hypothetical protein
MMPDQILFATAEACGFRRLPLSPGVSVVPGRAAWELFTRNGGDEHLVLARIAIVPYAEKALRASAGVTPAAGQPEGSLNAAVTVARHGCAFCGASLAGRRRHSRYCGGRCRGAACRGRRATA